MSDHHTAFDARPDAELGAALRAALEPGDAAAFTARVLGQLAGVRTPAWEVLAGWAGRGITAAAVAALVIGLLTGRAPSPAASWDDVVAPTLETDGSLRSTALLAAEQPPEPGALFASLVE